MGHTLVAVLSDNDEAMISNAVKNVGIKAPKIPFGRDCDRYAADSVLPYHITLFHWGRLSDKRYLPLVKKVSFSPCRATVLGSKVMNAENGSLLLYLLIRSTPSFDNVQRSISSAFGSSVASFLHMTLAVSCEHGDILRLKEELDKSFSYPFEVDIKGINLYHIWNPVELVEAIS